MLKNRQGIMMLVIGSIIGLLVGIAGSSADLFGSAADNDDDSSSELEAERKHQPRIRIAGR